MRLLSLSTCLLLAGNCLAQEKTKILSHPPLRVAPPPAERALANGPAKFVAPKVDDKNAGTKDAPWQTLRHAVSQLVPGETLYLRGGTYYEKTYISLEGTKEAPITLRSFPGEQAILDGSFPEFFNDP